MSDMIEKRTPEQIGAEIREYIRIQQCITLRCGIEIGERLIEAKKMLKHGEWLPWLNRETEISRTKAAMYMKLFKEYGEEIKSNEEEKMWTELPVTKAVALSFVPKVERESFAKEIDAMQIPVRALENEVRKKYGNKNAERLTTPDITSVDLKPCPFCGGQGELIISGRTQTNGNIKGYIIVKCTVCGAAGKGNWYYGPNVDQWEFELSESIGGEKAIAAWNMRWNG